MTLYMVISSSLEIKIQYLVVALAIVLSGSLIPFVFSNSYSSSLFAFLGLLACLILAMRDFKFSTNSTIYLLLLIVYLLFLMFYRLDFDNLQSYQGMIFRLLLAFLVTNLVSKKNFIEIYTNVVVVYSLLSLVMYAIGIVYPDFIHLLPISFNDAGTGYRHLYVYFYQGIDVWNFRNSGLFWEAGAFQVFVSLALLFEFFYLSLSRWSLIRKIILVTTVATTASTVGILVLSILFVVNMLKKDRC